MPTGSTTELWAAWVEVAGSSAAARRVFESVGARYAEPHRRYHGAAHLRHVVADSRRLARLADAPTPSAVVLAAFFHDAVYDPRSATNEVDSAALAWRELSPLGCEPSLIGEVERLVLLTSSHVVAAGDVDGAVLLDADLAVLGAEPAAYGAYCRAVRAEYAHVDDDLWRVGRAAVLHRFLDRPAIYHTSPMAAAEHRARANITAELASLTA